MNKEMIQPKNKRRKFKDKEMWRKNLSVSLKGRKVWNKNKKGLQKAWNKLDLSQKEILDLYIDREKSINKISKIYNVSRTPITRILKENKINLRESSYYIKGKTKEEIYGIEKAKSINEKMLRRLKGRKVSTEIKIKISEGIKKYYKKNPINDEYKIRRSEFMKKKWLEKEYRKKIIKKHKERLKNNPKELERLKNIQICKITGIEIKMLNFLREHFSENKDFYFDKQDLTGKTFYRPDFQFPKQKVIIELDGYYKHFTKMGKQKDKIRDYYLKKAGWNVYRYGFLDIERDFKFKNVKENILNLLKNG